MRNKVIHLDKERGKLFAWQYFIDMCGLHKRRDISPKHLDESLKTLDSIYPQIEVKAVLSRYEEASLEAGHLVLDGVQFNCQALEETSIDFLTVYAYILTIGAPDWHTTRVLHQVYFDMWETAFVDAGRDLLQEYIVASQTRPHFFVSDPFGPGFFGMPVTDTRKFFQILNGESIGARVKPNGFIVPAKSYAGIMLVTDNEISLPSKDCKNCISSRKTCSYCKTGRQSGPDAGQRLVENDLFEQQQPQAAL